MAVGSSSHEPRGLRAKEVCEQMGIQPYVLQFWENEFPQLGRRVGAKRLYKEESLTIVGEIHRLVEDERLTLAEARESLEKRFPARQSTPDEPRPEKHSGRRRAAPEPAHPPQQSLFEEAETRIQQLEQELEAARQRVSQAEQLEARVRELEAACQEEANQAAAAREQADESAERMLEMRASFQSLQQEQSALTQQIERAQAAGEELEESERACRGLQKQLAERDRQLAKLRESLSNRVDTALSEVRALLELVDPVS